MTRTVIRHAPAKINLYLHITGKRDDGYHLLDSMVVFAKDVSDIVTVTESDGFSFSMTGLYADGLGDTEHNLAVRAAKLFCDVTQKPLLFSLDLEKNIPSGAGLGGGSADAAATIHAIEEFYGVIMPDRNRHLITLGADVPVCFRGTPCRFKGIGEIMQDIPTLPALHMLLVWPGAHTATKDVFRGRDASYQPPVSIPPLLGTVQQLLFFLRGTGNDLTNAAESITPVIAEANSIVSSQDGCLLSRMSGSGSAIYGLFETEQACFAAREEILTSHPLWWVEVARI